MKRVPVNNSICIFAATLFLLPTISAAKVVEAETVEIVVHLDRPTKPISPLIYGSNIHGNVDDFDRFTVLRNGGNPVSTLNWESNCNNAGTDYQQMNCTWVCRFIENTPLMNEPAGGVLEFHDQAKVRGAYALMQVPMIGYVAADSEGTVANDQAAPSKRWKRLQVVKNAPFADPPDLTDDVVYFDEMLAYVVKRLGPADRGGIRGYCLDNEPDWWSKTHPLIHPGKTTVADLMKKSIAWAVTIKQIDPGAEIFGPSVVHMAGYTDFAGAPDWPEIQKEHDYSWFLDYYLDTMRQASEAAGFRLLDVLDVHAYTEQEIIRAGGQEAVLQGPRWLWDTTYRQPSWIGEVHHARLPLLPKIRESIEKYFPGTKIAITEYNTQMPETIYGSIAQVDELGVFGREGVYLATIWSQLNYGKQGDKALPLIAAFSLYRNFDGNGGCFGDQAIEVTNPRVELATVFAARDSSSGQIHVIVATKTRHMPVKLVIRFAGAGEDVAKAEQWGYDGNSYAVKFIDEPPLADGVLKMEIPKLTARHIVLSKAGSGYKRGSQAFTVFAPT